MFIKQLPEFKGIPGNSISDLADKILPIDLKPKDKIVLSKTDSDGPILIVAIGEVVLKNGTEVVATLQKGSVWGDLFQDGVPPKVTEVVASERSVVFQINMLLESGLMSADDRVLLPLPLHHVYPFVVGMLTPLACEAPIIMPHSLTGPEIITRGWVHAPEAETLLRALAAIPNRDWRLTCVGSPDRDPVTAQRLCERLRADGLEDRVRLAGEMDTARLAVHYDSADIFVLPTLYEGYGMAVAEALARGLPIVSTDTGAIGELVGDEAGLLVPPGDVDALAAALVQVLDDAQTRDRLEQGARRVRDRLPTWEDASGRMAEALSQFTIHN